ncbi:MAG: hypothetical protein FWF51_09135 [Chitinivibrionia bacterium]|nr:hypothetical protein [Chitinivibrionia bacterium]
MIKTENPQGISSIRHKDNRNFGNEYYKFDNDDVELNTLLKEARKNGEKFFFPNLRILKDNSW